MVFITYSQVNPRNPKHFEDVNAFAKRLKAAGINVQLDQFAQEEEFHFGGPPGPNGWGGWSFEQIGKADKVLIIGSQTYYRICNSEEPAGKGLGAAIEAHRIFQILYDSKGENHKFRLAILNKGDDEQIPDWISGYHRFYPQESDKDFNNLVAWLQANTANSGREKEVDITKLTWPLIKDDYQLEIANRVNEFAFFKQMLCGKTPERAIFLEAQSNHGKTTLIKEFRKYASLVIPSYKIVTIDFKGSPTKEFVLQTLQKKLGNLLPNFQKHDSPGINLRRDLQNLSTPLLLLFDSYEKASPEADDLIFGQILADLEDCPAIRVVIAGQVVPDYNSAFWAHIVQFFRLGNIMNPKDWLAYVRRNHANATHINEKEVKLLIMATNGNPGVLRTVLKTAAEENFS